LEVFERVEVGEDIVLKPARGEIVVGEAQSVEPLKALEALSLYEAQLV
jgi:hypothetical protein